ncbi:hypothetical protein [Telmatospirillum sp. J64-1]|nr:hypothetical protein [Telmatospirillum sp. J64-1]
MRPEDNREPGVGVYGDSATPTKKSGASWLLWLVVLLVIIALLAWAFM